MANVRVTSAFYGAPATSQWPSVPWYLLMLGFSGATAGSLLEYKSMLTSGVRSQGFTYRRRAVIEEAQHIGLGFWNISYSYRVGPKLLSARRVCGTAPGNTYFGEFIPPWWSDYKSLTTVGSEVDVYFAKGDAIADTSCLKPGVQLGYVVGGLVPIASLGAATYVSGRRLIRMLRFHTLHTDQQGITLLRKGEMHDLTGQKGPNPVDAFLSGHYKPGFSKTHWSLGEFERAKRLSYENQFRAQPVDERALASLKKQVYEEEERAKAQRPPPGPDPQARDS
ncbi:hypothetical protein DIPPA_17136 [Diplonema papillatum]|nr:hypothetical protein DIPPA_17136 [Diplonema papillatum]